MADILAESARVPMRFPDTRAEARARAEEFRRLTPEDRWREIAALMALGLNMARMSPRRAAIAQRWEAQEREWCRLQKTVFVPRGRPRQAAVPGGPGNMI
jgi:hypothetical protein